MKADQKCLAMVAGATPGNGQTVGCEIQTAKVKLGSRSLGKIQTNTAFVLRKSLCTVEKRKVLGTEWNPVYRKYYEKAYMACSVEFSPI